MKDLACASIAVALVFALAGPAGAQKASQDPQDKVRLQAKLVNVPVTVIDKEGRYITGFSKEDFEVYDDGVRQQIEHFSDQDAPISLGIVYDVSGSMNDLTARSFAALRRLFQTSHEDDEFFVIAFNDRAKLLQDFTTSPSEIMGRVTLVKARGSTALYDAVYLAVEKVRQGRHPRKAILVISDGEDNNSRYSGRELNDRIKEADVLIYAIGISKLFAGAGTLKRLAGLTGGRAFFPLDDNEVGDVYTRMALALRHQYVLGFYPSDTSGPARWHKLRVKVRAPRTLGRLSVIHKKGYQSFN
ncbi:MAG TPA: VWA domain-containing protein [Blastocatellia bacterium]|nr:VWA domain-containing protein [Blastocatellia bacterium]